MKRANGSSINPTAPIDFLVKRHLLRLPSTPLYGFISSVSVSKESGLLRSWITPTYTRGLTDCARRGRLVRQVWANKDAAYILLEAGNRNKKPKNISQNPAQPACLKRQWPSTLVCSSYERSLLFGMLPTSLSTYVRALDDILKSSNGLRLRPPRVLVLGLPTNCNHRLHKEWLYFFGRDQNHHPIMFFQRAAP